MAAEFVVGPENRLAAAVAEAFFQGRSQHYSPLVIYGPSGSGKSHLAQGLARWWRTALPSASVLVTCGSELARDYAAALDRQQLGEWRAALRSHDLVVVEDLGQLAGKGSAQQELLHVLDDLAGSDAMVVVTARSLPQQISALLAGLRSRLSAGLAVPLALPGPDARRTILGTPGLGAWADAAEGNSAIAVGRSQCAGAGPAWRDPAIGARTAIGRARCRRTAAAVGRAAAVARHQPARHHAGHGSSLRVENGRPEKPLAAPSGGRRAGNRNLPGSTVDSAQPGTRSATILAGATTPPSCTASAEPKN